LGTHTLTTAADAPLQLHNITMDNASNNDTLVTELRTLLADWVGEKGRIRCFGHVLNLTARRLMRPFDMRPEELAALLREVDGEDAADDLTSTGTEGEEEDDDVLDGETPAKDEELLAEDEAEDMAAMSGNEREELLSQFREAAFAINKASTYLVTCPDPAC
jgi:hypothetical protein